MISTVSFPQKSNHHFSSVSLIEKISSLRMLSVSPFQNRWFANIREFYDDNGSLKPGRKGMIFFLFVCFIGVMCDQG